MAVIGKNVDLHRQKGSGRVGNIDTVQPALFGNGLGTNVLLQRDGKIGTGLHPGIIGKDHGPVAVDFSNTRDHATTGDILDTTGIVHPKPCNLTEFKKHASRVDQLIDQVANRFLALFGQAVQCFLSSRPGSLVHSFVQLFLFIFPKCPIFLSSLVLFELNE